MERWQADNHYLAHMLLKIHPQNPEPRKLKQVIECLAEGGVVILPTDTIYALGCSIFQGQAVDRICRIRQVQLEKSHFSFICHDLSNISEFTRPFDRQVYKMLNRCLPGPYTFILNGNSRVPALFRSKKKTIGIRVPDNAIALAIVQGLGNPVMSTSMHVPDEILEYPSDPEEIHERYGKLVDMVIDGGTGNIIPSTVVDFTGDEASIIREGAGDIALLES
jgi:tRNA threonylcarbamoyl adenosine modification protein (Sua5/YciO/YrdC/YwlC family)